ATTDQRPTFVVSILFHRLSSVVGDCLVFSVMIMFFFFFFKQKTAYEIGLGIPAEPLFRSKALMFLTLMRPSLVLFLVLWLKLVKDFLKVRCRLALLPFLISCLIWLDLVASLPLIKERILV